MMWGLHPKIPRDSKGPISDDSMTLGPLGCGAVVPRPRGPISQVMGVKKSDSYGNCFHPGLHLQVWYVISSIINKYIYIYIYILYIYIYIYIYNIHIYIYNLIIRPLYPYKIPIKPDMSLLGWVLQRFNQLRGKQRPLDDLCREPWWLTMAQLNQCAMACHGASFGGKDWWMVFGLWISFGIPSGNQIWQWKINHE